VYSSLIWYAAAGPADCADIAGAAQASSKPIDIAKEIVFMGQSLRCPSTAISD
jgi:hypothetical protein